MDNILIYDNNGDLVGRYTEMELKNFIIPNSGDKIVFKDISQCVVREKTVKEILFDFEAKVIEIHSE